MKSFSTLFASLSLGLSFLLLVSSFDDDHRTCTDKMNDDPQFEEKCVELYCRCMDDCSGGKNKPIVGPDGVLYYNNADYSVNDCFKNNGCSIKNEMDAMIDCTTCIMERPEDTYRCAEYMEEKREADAKKKATAKKIEESKKKKAEEQAKAADAAAAAAAAAKKDGEL